MPVVDVAPGPRMSRFGPTTHIEEVADGEESGQEEGGAEERRKEGGEEGIQEEDHEEEGDKEKEIGSVTPAL